MNTSSLVAPGRMDVVEHVLAGDPFFKDKMDSSGKHTIKNRRGVVKVYSGLTVALVTSMAQRGLDAVAMGKDEVIAKAFEVCAQQ